jgi:hypothetical protein
MGFTSFTTAELNIDKPITSTSIKKIRNNIEWMKNAYQYNLSNLPNPDFEYVENGLPALWDCATYEGGYVGVSTSVSYNGGRSLMFVHDGGTRSGGEAVSDFIPMGTVGNASVTVYWAAWGTTTVKYMVKFIQYDRTFTPLSTITETTWATVTSPNVHGFTLGRDFAKAAGARWSKIKFMTSTAAGDTAAGTVYIDNALRYFNTPGYEY